MIIRVGKVVNIYPDKGKVKVHYSDTDNTSLPLPMITMNNEYLMPKIGDTVLALHMTTGSSKGFILGTYYNENRMPKTDTGYRKDIDDTTYITCINGECEVHIGTSLLIKSSDIKLECSYGTITVEEIMKRIERIEDALNIPHTI